MPKQPRVYMLASKRNGTLYIGMTSDLFNRTSLHQQDLIEGFTKRYSVHRLVYYEVTRCPMRSEGPADRARRHIGRDRVEI